MAIIQTSQAEQEFQPTHVTIVPRTSYTMGVDTLCSARNGECLFGDYVRVTEVDHRGSVLIQLPTGDSGWVLPSNLSPAEPWRTSARERLVIVSKDAPVLLSDSPDARPIELLLMGSIVQTLHNHRQESLFTEVVLADGRIGWIEGRLLEQCPANSNDPSTVPSLAAARALKLLGTPYRDGGGTPCGLNAAGLVHLAYRLSGLAISQSTFRLMQDSRFTPVEEGLPLTEGDFRPGDLLVFQLPSERHLLGLALGNREFITVTYSGWMGRKEGAYVHSCGDAQFAGGRCLYMHAKRLTRM